MNMQKIKWGKDPLIMVLAIGLLLGVVMFFSILQKKAALQDAKRAEQELNITGAGCYGQ